ncbi:MAG: hypothetical protein K2M50_09550 [Treponemataceae bacterium]|nr:hypothetical protein [Treponemataceae bacterium]
MDRNLKELEKEMKALGIINIAASGELTPEFAREAIDAVKSVNIDFEEIASQIESNRKAFVK